MAMIVELREMSTDKLEENLENAREEMFNLRFQQASARLENTARLKEVRREIAQYETVLRARRLAVEVAVEDAEIAAALGGADWNANARYVYEEAAWKVDFSDKSGTELLTALIDLNVKRPKGRAARLSQPMPSLVVSHEVAA